MTYVSSVPMRNGFMVHTAFAGEIKLYRSAPVRQSCGAVYGIWADTVRSPAPPGVIPFLDHPDWFPVYWGKDIAPCSRILAHVRNYRETGNAKLKQNKVLQGRRLLFGAILVSDYEGFERHLHRTYRPLIGRGLPGKKSKLIRIEG